MTAHSEVAEDVAGIAKLLKSSESTIYRLARSGTIPGFKVGSEWRFMPSAVLEALTPQKDNWAQPARSSRKRRAR